MRIIELLEASASDDELRARWGDFDSDDKDMLPRTQTNLEPAATLWTALEVVQDILGKNNVTDDEDNLAPGMYYIYQSTNQEPMFRDTDDGVGSINLPNLNSTSAKDVATAAHEACHALAHRKAQGGRVFSNEKIINNMAERWLRKHLTGTQLHAALNHIVKSRVSYGTHHLPK